MKAWQLISTKKRGLFEVLKDPDAKVWISTIELPEIGDFGSVPMDIGYKYETCLFTEDVNEVVAQYNTLDEAIAGHEMYRKKYGLV